MKNTAEKLTFDSMHVSAALKQQNLDLALSAAKRARRHATLLVQQIAAERESLQH